MSLISNLRVGVSLGMIEGISLDLIGGLIGDAQPATVMAMAGKRDGAGRTRCRQGGNGPHTAGLIRTAQLERQEYHVPV